MRNGFYLESNQRIIFSLQWIRTALSLPVYLSEWDDELTQVLLSAVEADVVVGDEQLSDHVHLSKRRPQRAVCVSIQALVLRQPEHCPVPLILCPGVKISADRKTADQVKDEEEKCTD